MTDPFATDISTQARLFITNGHSKNLTCATAESCTGGLIGAALTSVSGASRVFIGGVIAYDNSVKTDLLSVSTAMIARHGAVSSEVAKAMAEGILNRVQADIGLSVTGIAGPDGGTDEKPIGTVWIGVATRQNIGQNTRAYPLQLGSIGRHKIRDMTVLKSLEILNEIMA